MLRQLEGIRFEASFVHVDDVNSFRFMIAMSILEGMIVIVIVTSNIFQTDIIYDPIKRQYGIISQYIWNG